MRRLLSALVILLGTACAAHALRYQQSTNLFVGSDESLSDETWLIVERHVEFRGSAEDDVFLISTTADMAGAFSNDLWAVSSQVTLSGDVSGHARLAGRTVRVTGRVGRNLGAAGETVEVDTDGVIGREATLLGQDVLFKGQAASLRVIATKATISGKVNGRLRVAAPDIVIMPGTEIAGDLVYTSPQELVLDKRVVLGGELKRVDAPPGGASPPASESGTFSSKAYLYMAALLAGLPFVGIFPHFTGRAVRALRQGVGRCALVGLVAFCLLPMISLFAIITIVGIPLGLVIGGSFVIMLYFAKIFVALAIGGALLRRRGPQPFWSVFTALSLGLLLLYLAAAVPVLSGIVWIVCALLGLGAMVGAVLSSEPRAVINIAAPPPVPPGFSPPSSPDQNDNMENTYKE